MKRNFYPGDEWLYFKIYGGIKACDDLPDFDSLRYQQL